MPYIYMYIYTFLFFSVISCIFPFLFFIKTPVSGCLCIAFALFYSFILCFCLCLCQCHSVSGDFPLSHSLWASHSVTFWSSTWWDIFHPFTAPPVPPCNFFSFLYYIMMSAWHNKTPRWPLRCIHIVNETLPSHQLWPSENNTICTAVGAKYKNNIKGFCLKWEHNLN